MSTALSTRPSTLPDVRPEMSTSYLGGHRARLVAACEECFTYCFLGVEGAVLGGGSGSSATGETAPPRRWQITLRDQLG